MGPLPEVKNFEILEHDAHYNGITHFEGQVLKYKVTTKF